MRLTTPYKLRFTIFALLAFALRALIPAGFMPASGHPFELMVCREGMQASQMVMDAPGAPDHARAPDHSGVHDDHCPFGVASLPGPAPSIAVAVLSGVAPGSGIPDFEPVSFDLKLVHLPHPRGPPTPISSPS